MSESEQKKRGVRTGKVISNKMDKTIVVLLVRKVPHLKYGKYIKRSSKIHAHDEANVCKIDDVVLIRESRPRSKKKSWELVEVISNGE